MRRSLSLLAVALTSGLALADAPVWKGAPAGAHPVFRPDSKQVALAGRQGNVALYELPSGRRIALESGLYSFGQGTYSPDGKTLLLPAVGFQQPHIAQYGLGLGQLTGPDSAPKEHNVAPGGTPWVISYTADGKVLTGGTGQARLLDPATLRPLREFAGHGEVRSFAVSPSGRLLAQTDGDCVQIFDFATGKELARGAPLQRVIPINPNNPDEPSEAVPIQQVLWSPDEKTVLASSYSNPETPYPILVIDAQTGKKVARFETHHVQAITGMALSPDGKTLVTTSYDGELRWWDFSTRRLIDATHCLGDHKLGFVTGLAFSPDSQWLALGTEWSLAQLYAVPTHSLQAVISDEPPPKKDDAK